jgi:hypothetical protein
LVLQIFHITSIPFPFLFSVDLVSTSGFQKHSAVLKKWLMMNLSKVPPMLGKGSEHEPSRLCVSALDFALSLLPVGGAPSILSHIFSSSPQLQEGVIHQFCCEMRK